MMPEDPDWGKEENAEDFYTPTFEDTDEGERQDGDETQSENAQEEERPKENTEVTPELPAGSNVYSIIFISTGLLLIVIAVPCLIGLVIVMKRRNNKKSLFSAAV